MLKIIFVLLAISLPTHDDYPRHYLVYDSLHYKVLSESDRPQWYFEDEGVWLFSDDYRTEKDLMRCEVIERIR
jgi:hypothetical protein